MQRNLISKELRRTKTKPILIVEDEAATRDSVCDFLSNAGYRVYTANDGIKALEIIPQQDFGLVILGLKLPGKNGIQVLREAKVHRPQFKAIIITAYPTIEGALEAGREGAIAYLRKPLDLTQLEKQVSDILGPIEIDFVPETTKLIDKFEDITSITLSEVSIYLNQGKASFLASEYEEARKKLEAILKVAPGSLEARVWLAKTKQALMQPKAEVIEEAIKPKFCVWVSLGMVSDRLCINDYNCGGCDFDKEMQQKMAAGGGAEIEAALAKLKSLPGIQRLCRYAVKGDVSHRVCSRLFDCATCEFGQLMGDAAERMLSERVAELLARQEALRKKEQSWWWTYWKAAPATIQTPSPN